MFDTGANSATMKVHLMYHVTECVRNWGPIWAYSCFSFESQNRVIKTLFHGTRQMNFQVFLTKVRQELNADILRTLS